MNGVNKRERLIDSAAELFYHKGFNVTSLADIAKHADIPIGNVYYYFKTKDELALAALDKRKQSLAMAYAHLENFIADPRQRLIESLRFFENVRDEYTRFGCPIGKIVLDTSTEKPGEKDIVAEGAANVFAGFVEWATQQFELLGHEEKARDYAISLMAGIQGAAIMAKTFKKADIISTEIGRLTEWLSSLPNKKIFLGKAGMKQMAMAEA